MKATILALVTLAAGAGLGYFLTQREFGQDVLPIGATPTGGSAGSKPSKVGPKVTMLSSERFEFGTMDRTEHKVHDFIVLNDGDAPLTLSTGEPSCGICVKVFRVDKNKLEPGEKAAVRIEWEAKPSESEFEQSGPLHTDDPQRPKITLTVHGRVIDTVRAERNDMHFHDISTSQSVTNAVNIYAFRSSDLKIEKFDFSDANIQDYFGVSFVPLTAEELAKEPEAKSGLKATIEVKPGMPIGSFNQTIHLTTNQNSSQVTINVIGNVASDILLSGPRVDSDHLLVSLPPIVKSEGVKHLVYLRVKGSHRDETQLRIASVEPATEFSATLGKPNRENPKVVIYPLSIEVPANALSVNHLSEGAYAKVHIATTHPDIKELIIKVRYLVKE